LKSLNETPPFWIFLGAMATTVAAACRKTSATEASLLRFLS
jgi:hypothetical protein